MRERWRIESLADLGTAVRESATLLGDSEYELWSVPSFANDEPEVVTGRDIGSAKLLLQPNDILICKINPRINRVWLVREPIEGRDQLASTEWLVFRVGSGAELDPRWVVHFASSPAFRERIASDVSGATGSHTRAKPEGILRQQIPVPPLETQRRIVAILDEAFADIAVAKANAEKNVENARAVFDVHLQSVFSVRGSTWRRQKLGDVTEVQSGGTPSVSRKEFWGGEIPWFSSGELNETFTAKSHRTITEEGLRNSNAKLFPRGSLLIGMYDTAALKMSILDRDAAFNQAIAGVKPDDAIDLEFCLHAINAMKAGLLLERRGVRQKNLSLAKIKGMMLPLPALGEQRAVVVELRESREETKRLESTYQRKLAALDELKQSLLHQAFTGRLTTMPEADLEAALA